MQLRIGNSIEFADMSWRKHDVTLDEYDLQKLLVEAGLDPDTEIPLQTVFEILEAEAQKLLMYMMIVRYPLVMKTPDNIQKLYEFKTKRDELLESLRTSQNG